MFSIQLKKLREGAGLSQQAFADKFGVAQSTVGGWEAGKREPNFQTIIRLADFFHVTTDELLGASISCDENSVLVCMPGDHGYWDGSRLCDERMKRGYSIEHMSSLLYVSPEEYRQLENGSLWPSTLTVLRLADIFPMELDHLFHRLFKLESGDVYPMREFVDADEAELLREYRNLNNIGKVTARNMLKGLLSTHPGEKALAAPKEA